MIRLACCFAIFAIALGSRSMDQRLLAEDTNASLHARKGQDNPPHFDSLPESTWQEVERSVDRGVTFLINHQNSNGSFGRTDIAASGITALAGMALISRGHCPSERNGASQPSRAINKAVDYVLSVARPNGLISRRQSDYRHKVLDKAAMYNHAIAGMFLCEVYGMVDAKRAARIEAVVPKALRYIRQVQLRPLPPSAEKRDRGGWRYDPAKGEGWVQVQSDLSVTAWIVMFMRSAENAGFDVPKEWADQALDYVERCYLQSQGAFTYSPGSGDMVTRAMVGAGVLCLFLTGNERPEMEQRCGRWLVEHPPHQYNRTGRHEHYHYSLYYASQAAMQLGGEVWVAVYTPIYRVLLRNQQRDGSWKPEGKRPELGNEYTTALSILALTPPHQLLPIYQR